MRVEQKLQEMGLTLPDLPQPNGLYVPSRRVGNLIYIAGQTPDIHGVRQVVGVVGEDLTIEDGQRSARICALNILAVLKAELGDLDKVKQFVQIICQGISHPAVYDSPACIHISIRQNRQMTVSTIAAVIYIFILRIIFRMEQSLFV